MVEHFNGTAKLYFLNGQKWSKIGKGLLILTTYTDEDKPIMIKLTDDNHGSIEKSEIGTEFPCYPKGKPKGNNEYAWKGYSPITNTDYVLAARFNTVDEAQLFRFAFENAVNNEIHILHHVQIYCHYIVYPVIFGKYQKYGKYSFPLKLPDFMHHFEWVSSLIQISIYEFLSSKNGIQELFEEYHYSLLSQNLHEW